LFVSAVTKQQMSCKNSECTTIKDYVNIWIVIKIDIT
jgi:hypothetical protein